MNNEYNDIQEFGNKERNRRRASMKHRRTGGNDSRLKIILAALAVLVIIIVIVLAATKCGSDDSSNKKVEETKKEDTKTENAETTSEKKEETELVAIASDSEIFSLVLAYMDAAYVQCDVSLLETIVDSLENVNVEKNQVRQRYIESYNDIAVYMLDGKEDINVIFVSYNAKLYNYDTMLPSGETLKVKKGEDGKYKIHNIEVGEKFETHMTNEGQIQALGMLQEKIQSEYNAVIEGNSEIKDIVDILNGAKIE